MLKGVGSRKEFACCCLLLVLVLLLLKSSSSADGLSSNNKKSSDSDSSAGFRPNGSFSARKREGAVGAKGDDSLFGEEKRRVYTGPNPLHNR